MRDDADDAIFLSSSYGLTPDEWQAWVLRGWLGVRRDGKWSAPRAGLACPRQNGKNGILEIRELYGMVGLGERILHTAHEVKTARKAFLRLLHFFDNERHYPELKAITREIRRTNGQEAITLRNGGSIEFIARSKGSGRGFTVDVLVMDEAQELSDDTLAALLPTISAAPLGNPQQIYIGTPPAPSMNGEVFTRTRLSALQGKDKRVCWDEWSCPSDADLDSVESLAQSNPALGGRLGFETTTDERAQMDDQTYGRERLGMWDDASAADPDALDIGLWRDLADNTEDVVDRVTAFAVTSDLDRAWASIGLAGERGDGLAQVELVDRDRGTRWVVARCVELANGNGHPPFVVDGGGPVRDLIPKLEDAGLEVITAGVDDVARSYTLFVDAMTERTLRHGPDPFLDDAVKTARRRPCGERGYAFGRRASGADIGPIEACALALLASELETAGPSLW